MRTVTLTLTLTLTLTQTLTLTLTLGVSTILGHGQKKTTLSGVILNKGDLKINVIVADAFGAEGKTTTPAVPGGAPGVALTVKVTAVT